MARQEIILGTAPTGLGGDPPRTASQKINFMTKELYAAVESMGTAATRDVQLNTLDNTAGKLLGPGAFGLGTGAPGAADLFALPGSGFYYSNPGGGTQNPMSNAAGLTLHAGGGNSGGGGFQLYGRDNTFLFRGFTSGAHSPTRMVYHDGNAVGLVGAGAIIERGVTGNGEFVKLADGSVECWFNVALTPTANTELVTTWTLPTQVIVTNHAQATVSVIGPGATQFFSTIKLTALLYSTTTVQWRVKFDTTQTYTFALNFKGRWK